MGFYCIGFSIKLVKTAQASEACNLLTSGQPMKGHVRRTCWKLKSQMPGCIL